MKTGTQVAAMRCQLRQRLLATGLSDIQRATLIGMLNAIVWVADGEHASTMDRLMSGEQVSPGNDHMKAMSDFDAAVRALKREKR